MNEKFRFNKGESVTEDMFKDIESAVRGRTISKDSIEDDITSQYANEDFEVIIKSWRRKK